MNNGIVLMSICILLACNNNAPKTVEVKPNEPSALIKETGSKEVANNWQQNFKLLKQAIVSGNKNAVKDFVQFPIENKGNEIWYFGDDALVMEIPSKPIKPFTASDFDTYFSPIFGIDLRKSLEKIDETKLFENNSTQTEAMEIIPGAKTKLTTSFNAAEQKITMELESIINENKGYTQTRFYYFDVANGKDIWFTGVHAE